MARQAAFLVGADTVGVHEPGGHDCPGCAGLPLAAFRCAACGSSLVVVARPAHPGHVLPLCIVCVAVLRRLRNETLATHQARTAKAGLTGWRRANAKKRAKVKSA